MFQLCQLGGNRARFVAVAAVLAVSSGCGGDSEGTDDAGAGAGGSSGTAQVLPVKDNPISNDATAKGLAITKALVENNVSAETGKDVPDHLEVALKNTSSKPLEPVEVYYKIVDDTKGVSEGYHAKLDGFRIEPGKTRVAHFDETDAEDHYPVNKYSLYYTDKNELFVEVTASAPGVQPATFKVRKDAADAEESAE
jgi:hypothetical protein